MATHSSIHAWKIPWTEEPSRLQSMGRKELDTPEQLILPHFVVYMYIVYIRVCVYMCMYIDSRMPSLVIFSYIFVSDKVIT